MCRDPSEEVDSHSSPAKMNWPLDASSQDGDTPTQAPTSMPLGHDAGLNEASESPDISSIAELDNNIDGLKMIQNGFETMATIGDDGRVNINIHQWSNQLPDILAPAFEHEKAASEPQIPSTREHGARDAASSEWTCPRLNIVMQVVGSRGDVQPFVALGKILKEKYGHRIRLATHPIFQDFVEENGLEFFSLGGDPVALMAFMVKNPRFLPSMESIRNGDATRQRGQMFEIFKGCWRSCIETGDGVGILSRPEAAKPFVADAIIANPPSFAHIHCAERLGIPLHLMFTMPWSPTRDFPHPLARITSTNADPGLTNFVSYALVRIMIWQGLGGLINQFRKKALGLEPVSLMWAPGMTSRLKIPYTYFWSPALIPKPRDWNTHIYVSGFCHLPLASSYNPSSELLKFLESGPPPIYIGFGSIVVSNPIAMTDLILDAVRKAGVRAIISRGWGGFATQGTKLPDGVFVVDNIPHDWLFPKVSCVVHHGGAGTTAAGIMSGKPTVIVPFFGDQPFWGMVIARAGAGPSPIAFKDLTSDTLSAGIKAALQPEVLERVSSLACTMSQERGSQEAADSFHSALDIDALRCSLSPERAAVWRVKQTNIRLSALAAAILMEEKALSFDDLKRYRPREYDLEDGPWDPISGGASALLGTLGSLVIGVAAMPNGILRALKVKSAKASDDHETEDRNSTTNNSSTTPPTAPKRSISFPLPETSISSEVPSPLSYVLEFASSSATSPSSELSRNSTSRNNLFDVGSKGKRRQRFRTKWLSRHRNHSSQSGSKGVAPGDDSCFIDASGYSRCLSPGPNIPEDHTETLSINHKECQTASKFALENATASRNSAARIMVAGLKFPMDFALHVAKGFHNAPKLYGDNTVRPLRKIEGLKTGLKSSGREFAFGVYDGISGVVTQPIRGAKGHGPVGFVEGVGKGVGGLVLKPLAALWGVPGYTLHGAYKEIQKHFVVGPNCVHLARTLQGSEESKMVSQAERRQIIKRWSEMQT